MRGNYRTFFSEKKSNRDIYWNLYSKNENADHGPPPCPVSDEMDLKYQGEEIPLFLIESIEDADLFRI